MLLIAADLNRQEVRSLTATAHELALEVLLELHSEQELDYAETDVDAVGVNNRNLGTFVTDVQNSFRMASRLPQDKVLVSESGIASAATIRLLREAGYRGFLIGESFMKSDKPAETLKDFISQI